MALPLTVAEKVSEIVHRFVTETPSSIATTSTHAPCACKKDENALLGENPVIHSAFAVRTPVVAAAVVQ
jgi:hypothetical protein